MFTTTSSLAQIDSATMAKYIAVRVGGMSHLKLQKLLYYCYALHLAYFDTALFEEKFEAWVHGPVSRTLWDMVKDHSLLHSDIKYTLEDGEEDPVELVKKTLTSDQIQLIDDTLDELGKLNGLQLENMTHSERPWNEARVGYNEGDRCSVTLNMETIQSYYKSWFS
jgi:uncharacterized phage-associated protein